MRNTLWGRILMYLTIWGILFLLLCVVSVIKNWTVLVAALEGAFASLISVALCVGLTIYVIVIMLRGLWQ